MPSFSREHYKIKRNYSHLVLHLLKTKKKKQKQKMCFFYLIGCSSRLQRQENGLQQSFFLKECYETLKKEIINLAEPWN
jgi:hypothetical protein